MAIIIIIITILAAYWLRLKFRNRHLELCGEKIPGDKAYFLIGNLWIFRNVKSIDDLHRKGVDYVNKYYSFGINRVWVGSKLFVMLWDVKYIQAIANSLNAEEKHSLYKQVFGKFGIMGTNEPDQLKILKDPLAKSMSKRHLENKYHEIFVRRYKNFIEHLRETSCGKETNIIHNLRNLSLDSFSETLLGVNTNEVQKPRFYFFEYWLRFFKDSFDIGAQGFYSKAMGRLSLSQKNVSMKENKAGMKAFLRWVLEERMKIGAWKEKGQTKYYSDLLLKRKLEKNMPIEHSMTELADPVIAGTDTSSALAGSVLLFLAMFPHIQEEAYKEQVSILGEDAQYEPTPKDLSSMAFLTRIIKETLRHISVQMIAKQATGDIVLDEKYTIPKGTGILVHILTIHHDQKYWENPNTFYPDHFLPEKEAARPRYAFIPFGFGSRICPGMVYGIYSTKMLVSFILRNFKLTTRLKFEDLRVENKLLQVFKSYNIKFDERV